MVNEPEIILPVPLDAMPVMVPVLVLVQLNVVPATALGLVIFIDAMAPPEQIVCVEGVADTVGTALMTTVVVVAAARQTSKPPDPLPGLGRLYVTVYVPAVLLFVFIAPVPELMLNPPGEEE